MSKIINIYCDESCHLEHDHQPIMLFGTVWCPQEDTRQHIAALRELKEKHRARGELVKFGDAISVFSWRK